MGDVIRLRSPYIDQNTRQIEASLLRKVIEERRVKFEASEGDRVAHRVDGFIDRHASTCGRGSITKICNSIWPGYDNSAGRRPDLRMAKKASTLKDYVERIAKATGAPEDDLLVEAFRDTSFDREVAALLQGKGPEPELEEFWKTLSGTLQTLCREVARVEKLGVHLERLAALQGCYDLAADAIATSRGKFLYGPLANSSMFYGEYPPIPSVLLFTEPKSDTVELGLTVRDSGLAVPIQMTVLREVRLAIGPADDIAVPAPLFEFRSVLQLVGPTGPLRIRRPWHDLETDEAEVELNGLWSVVNIPMPKASVTDAHLLKFCGPNWPAKRFVASLEAPLQFEHHDIVWRPVTAGTCRDILSRSSDGVTLGFPPTDFSCGPAETFCPPGSLAEALEISFHNNETDGLPKRLRAEANRLSTMISAWHAEQIGRADAVHRNLRSRWEDWS